MNIQINNQYKVCVKMSAKIIQFPIRKEVEVLSWDVEALKNNYLENNEFLMDAFESLENECLI